MKWNLVIGSLIILVIENSCKKIIEIAPPVNTVISETAFADDRTATATVIGIYAKMLNAPQYFSSYAFTLYGGLSADEISSTAANINYDPFSTNSLLPTTAHLNNIWRFGFDIIYHANACIEGIDQSATLIDSIKKVLKGEVLFMRAFANFYMSQFFGAIPLIMSTDYKINAALPRTSVKEVLEQIIKDLEEAKELLPTNYLSSGRARVSHYAARALLSRVYLYQQQWAKAETEASVILASGAFSLITDLNSVFLSNSNETIWQIDATGLTYNTFEGRSFIPSSATARPPFVISNFLLAAFETGDKRKTAWLKKNTIGGTDYFYPYKYKVRTGNVITENSIYLRLAEVYLIRAEARTQQENIAQGKQDLNLIRSRAGLSSTTANDKNSLLTVIERERQTELFAEAGHRWLDLKRTNRANTLLGNAKGINWQATDQLYPIPFLQIQLNPSLTQNEGY